MRRTKIYTYPEEGTEIEPSFSWLSAAFNAFWWTMIMIAPVWMFQLYLYVVHDIESMMLPWTMIIMCLLIPPAIYTRYAHVS